MLLPWAGGALIERTLGRWRESSCGKTVVVVHPDDAELADICRRAGAEVCIPERPPAEMKDSVWLALEHIAERFTPTEQDVWMLAPADMPDVAPLVIDRLLSEREGGRQEILVPVFDGRRGHPVLFPWPLAEKVRTLADDEGVDALLRRHAVREIDFPEHSAPADIDTPEDYRRQRPSTES